MKMTFVLLRSLPLLGVVWFIGSSTVVGTFVCSLHENVSKAKK